VIAGERSRDDDGTVKHVTGMAFHQRYLHDSNVQEALIKKKTSIS
jgi:hypothetical protein